MTETRVALAVRGEMTHGTDVKSVHSLPSPEPGSKVTITAGYESAMRAKRGQRKEGYASSALRDITQKYHLSALLFTGRCQLHHEMS